MKLSEQDIKTNLQRIANILLLNGGFLNNPGLYTGEMGIVLFFARYARYTQNELYLGYAYHLVGKIQYSIHQDTPINYKQGLAGIGSAIEYLVQNGFFEADTDEILEDFDRRIFFTYNLPYLPIEEIMDIGYYTSWRLSGNSSQKDRIQTIVMAQIEKIMHSHFKDPACLQLNRKIIPAGLKAALYRQCLAQISGNDFSDKAPILQNGLAGWGMSLLTELDGDDSWISLLTNNFTTSNNESLSVS